MARHAGFGAVTTVSSGLIDSVMKVYVEQGAGPVFFPAPTSIPVGPATVHLAGIFEMLPPTVELHPNPADLITLHFAFRSRLRARVERPVNIVGGQSSLARRYDVKVSGAVSLAPIVNIQNDQVVLGINTASVTFAPLTVVTLSGPGLPSEVVDALQSSELAAIASAFVQSRPNIMLTPPTLKTVIERVQPGDFPESGISVFEWFRIRLEASRIVVRPLEGAITVAVDFLGRTSGDPTQLVDLIHTHGGGNIWVENYTPTVWEQQGPPYIVQGSYPAGGNVAVLFNMAVLSAIVDSISNQTAHTKILKNVELRGLSAGYATFAKPLYPGTRNGLRVGFQATLHPTDVNVWGAIYLQPVIRIYDGPSDFMRAPAWSLMVAHSELNTPWWVDLAVFAIAVVAGAFLPGLLPILLVGAIAVVDGIIPSLVGNARNLAQGGVVSGLSGLGLPSPEAKRGLPGLADGYWTGTIHHVAVTPEGLDTALNVSVGTSDSGSRLIGPGAWHANYATPMAFSVKLNRALEAMASDLSVVWEVFRTDSNALLETVTRPYRRTTGAVESGIFLALNPVVRGTHPDPETNGIQIGLRQEDYYFLDSVRVRCTVTASLGSQVGEVWSSELVVPIEESLDRHHKFVEWGPHMVWFVNAGTGGDVWAHNRTSRIHRTAIGGRCMMLKQRASATGVKRPKFRYFDTLPFEWDQLYQHRHYLCEYCFFGGPDKTQPYPQDDWF